MKRSGGHRIPGLNCCGQGRMCYRWSKRYCWAGTGGDAHKNPHLSFSSKTLWERILLFLRKPQNFRLKGPVGYSLPLPSVWWVFSSALEFTEGTCYSRENLGFPRADRNGSDLPGCAQLSLLREHRWLCAFRRECGW